LVLISRPDGSTTSSGSIHPAASSSFSPLAGCPSHRQRADYRQFLQSQRINIVDCARPEMKDRSLRCSTCRLYYWVSVVTLSRENQKSFKASAVTIN
jgi:hypothetical protein